MNVASEARAHQAEELKNFRHADDLAEVTADLYDAVDSLSEPQRRVLARQLLQTCAGLVVDAVRHPELVPTIRTGIGVLGYLNELFREQYSETSTDDAALGPVKEALDQVHHFLILEQMSPEDEAEALALREEVDRRTAAGEDAEAVANDISARLAAKHAHPSNGNPAPAAPAVDERYGMYL